MQTIPTGWVLTTGHGTEYYEGYARPRDEMRAWKPVYLKEPIIKEVLEIVATLVDHRVPASEYHDLLAHHFKV